MFHTYMFLVGAHLPLVAASIYPTQPIQATVWSADQPMRVSWVEDWKYPQLSEMGGVDITLWCETDTYLVQLASGVDPMTKTAQVTVPGSVLKQGSKYLKTLNVALTILGDGEWTLSTLRFTTSKPIDTVNYSSDFAIVSANRTTGSVTGTGTGSGDVALATQSGTGTGTSTATGIGTESGFKTVTTTSATALSSGQPTTPSGVPPPSGTILGGGVPGQGQRAANAGRRGVDVEKLKFRFVFVIWPVLMGITMAL